MSEINTTTYKLVNLDNLQSEFYQWKNMYENLLIEKDQQQKELIYNKNQFHLAKNNETNLQEEKMQMKASIVNLQSTIQHLLYLEKKNAVLAQQLLEKEESLSKMKMEYDYHVELLNKNLQDSEKQHQITISEFKLQAKTEVMAQMESNKKIIAEKDAEISSQQEQIIMLQRIHKEEMIRMQLEYDHKLIKFQEQQIKSTRTSLNCTTATGTDILRKKMQNMQEQHRSEISGLKQTITTLEAKLRQYNENSSAKKEYDPQNNRLTLKKRRTVC